jgi:hypothetical protein
MSEATTRRRFLSCAVVLGAGGALSWWVGVSGCGRGARLDLSGIFGEVEPALEVGRDYLERFPEEASRAELEKRLLALLPGDAELAELRAALLGAIRRDFAEDRVFRHEGWVLSRTGGRLCALARLTLA